MQLLIFSLVTFPSTEFKLEIVASRVAAMVADRRRRVRQAALDALAVLGQIYDSEVKFILDLNVEPMAHRKMYGNKM